MTIALLCILALAPHGAFAFSPLEEEARQKGVELTERERRTLAIGEITRTEYLAGGILGTWPVGLGIGHAVQGRWRDRGWIFTAGEAGAIAMMAASGDCTGKILRNDDNECTGPNEVLLLGGLVGYVGFRVWEIADVWGAPWRHRRRLRKLERKIRRADPPVAMDVLPLLRPDGGAGAGVVVTF